MKKTIAILLVLVIGMVGVWAAYSDTETVLLTTTVNPINQMAVVPKETALSSYSWPTAVGGGFEGSSSSYNTTETAIAVDTVTGIESAFVRIAKLFARSNNRGGVNITVDATSLVDSASTSINVDSKHIDYSLKVGKANEVSPAAINFVDGEKKITSANVGSLTYADAVDVDEWGIDVKLDELLANAAAGTYNATITFTFATT